MKISDKDLETVKSLADDVSVDITQIASNRASAFLSIETIRHVRKSTRNNILFILLGALIGISPSIIESMKEEPNIDKQLLDLHKQLHDIELQLNHSQKNDSKKDSL
ncbi:hypothetical protein [Xanthomarina sp. GH4-25]|uniref:hypothetical protein n=1 Tax=Xanthomarina sp. GH4-25 TaxID=3349335 RepID=UPI003878439A